MNDKTSDYKKNNLNLNDFIPRTNRGELLESLNKNLFNRYLTKDEFDHIVGFIGDVDPNDKINKPIKERSSYRQDNQLQPVITGKIGSVNNFMGFEDFMTRIGRTGVDVDKFDEWGNALQFNWVPPIDLDKIVNYQDYYWDSNIGKNQTPQYVTIKSQKNWAKARYIQSLKTITEVVEASNISGYDTQTQTLFISGNVTSSYSVGDHLVIASSNGLYNLVTVQTVTYNVAAMNTAVTTVERFDLSLQPDSITIFNTEIPVIGVNENSITVAGDFSNLLTSGYIIGINVLPYTLLDIQSSTFDIVENATTIIVPDLPLSNFDKVSLYPILSIIGSEYNYIDDTNISFPTGVWNNNNLGKLLWFTNTEIMNGTTGKTFLGDTKLEDNSKPLTSYGITQNSKLHINAGHKSAGVHDISSVGANYIRTNSNQFFTESTISYRIVQPFNLEIISSDVIPSSPKNNQLWFEPSTDILSQYNGSTWNRVVAGISKLNSLISNRVVTDYTNDNDWSNDNEWVHRSQIREFTGMIRAQMPIIEYFPYLELSETSFSEKVWRYRKDSTTPYITVDKSPTMFELMDFTYNGGDEFTFVNNSTIKFNQKFGNFVNEINAGDKIKLSGFVQNNGEYTVASTYYSQPSSGKRFVSTITLTTPLISTTDLPVGAVVAPVETSMGDEFGGISSKHWEFGGIKNINVSSLSPIKNPMLDISVSTSTNNGVETILGLVSQTFSLKGTSAIEPTLMFDNSLHDLVLYDDYQEGDIRVYINGKRVYGTFQDIVSPINPDYVGGIKFVNGYVINDYDVVRVELGEYARDDIGLRAITINTPIGDELYNLTNIRKIEQNKTESNQYPYFALRDIFNNRLHISTPIFKFQESPNSPINTNMMRRIVMNSTGTDYTFTQELKDSKTGQLYCYYDFQKKGDELQTIWKHGTYSEQYVPIKVDGAWEMPNQWYYNINHENYEEVKLTEIFRHFKSIIDVQDQPGLFSRTSGLFFLDDDINYGIGGTIKEHNDGFDSLISSVFVKNGNPVTVINFAKDQYNNQIRYVKERYYQEASEIFSNPVNNLDTLQKDISETLINYVENNGKYDQWFGDTTSFDISNNNGVRNWIATIPQFGLTPRYAPYTIHDPTLGLYGVRCHDGHFINTSFTPAMVEQVIRRIATNNPSIEEVVPNDASPFPTKFKNQTLTAGVYYLRTDTLNRTRKLYRADSGGNWQYIDVVNIFSNAILEIENRLYDVLTSDNDVSNLSPLYNFDKIKTNPSFDDLMELQFLNYTKIENITIPLNNYTFSQNNPFTWNYSYTTIKRDPVTGNESYNIAGSWQALYEKTFGTAYPHLEPWKLQGYLNKPHWWDIEYKSSSTTHRWSSVMWDNIFAGIVPNGYNTPSGSVSTGLSNQIGKIFQYLPVNTSNANIGKYAPDDLLPPFWNSSSTNNSRIRSLHDPSASEFVTTPQKDYIFGQDGPVEWTWKNSGSYLYDLLVVSYKIDPMRFIHKTFGIDYQVVSCLQIDKKTEKVFSHKDVNFHGNFDKEKNETYQSKGLNQWYVHYNRHGGFDGIASEFRSLWKDWDADLSYLVSAFIDTPSFIIDNHFFDITTKDYEIAVKKTHGIDDKWLTSLTATVLSVPSPYAKLRDQSIGWSVEISNNSPTALPIKYHPVQNYPATINGNIFRIFSFPITGIEKVFIPDIDNPNYDPTNTNISYNGFKLSGNFYSVFSGEMDIVVSNSSELDGAYTIDRVYYDPASTETVILTNEIFNPSSVDGNIELKISKTLPDDWTTGTPVYFNTNGYLPSNLDDEIPFYIVRLNDREFSISETEEGAILGNIITPIGTPMGEMYVGKLEMTFTALGGSNNSYNWRQHAVDYRYVDIINNNLPISGIQYMVDFIHGYDAYTQSEGFRYKNNNGENYDIETGLNNNWQTVTEKFVSWLYELRNFQQETMLNYKIKGNSVNGTFETINGNVPNWQTGTSVILIADDSNGETLPAEFNNPLSSIIPYYVIRVNDSITEFKLAASVFDAARGNAIPLSDDGVGTFKVQIYKQITQFPEYELNPFKHHVWLTHEQGILSNVLDEDYTDIQNSSRLYDNNMIEMDSSNILVFREDKESRISLTENLVNYNNGNTSEYTTHMSGMHLFLDGYEHIIRFEDYSVDGSLIYDSFLGLNTPRFYVEFDRQKEFTLRPNVGGFYLQGDSLVQNFESTINDMRYYYDSIKAPEGRKTTDLVRKSLGYDGTKDYMNDLNINPKTQFKFWQAMIQNKGTSKAITAFTNQEIFGSASADEFWAYRLGEFGSAKTRKYMEMKLFPSDVVRSEFRAEFISNENTPVDISFEGIELRDMSRWWNQPDQIENMAPSEAFFFDTKVVDIVNDITPNIRVVNGKTIYVLGSFADSVIITYFDPITQKNITLNEYIEYKFLNSKIIEFLVDISHLPELMLSILSYDYDAQNPAKVIDKDAGVVVTNLPIWNPAFGHYNNSAHYAVDLHRPSDPAIYTHSLDGDVGTSSWKNDHVGTVWLDSSTENYIPYFDTTIYPDINDRIRLWGELAPWADISLYQWTKSDIPPHEYNEVAKQHSYDISIANDKKVTGEVLTKLYKNLHYDQFGLEPYWEIVEDRHYDFVAGLVADHESIGLEGKQVDVYINGIYVDNVTFEDFNSVRVYFSQYNFGDYCHAVVKAHKPTDEELRNEEYKYGTPHTIEKRFDSKSGEVVEIYYYWVKNKKHPISDTNPNISLYSANKALIDMTDPYIILQGIRTPDFGYGLIFGHIFDEFDSKLPYRYTQLIARGLQGAVKDANRYVMRFTRDFTLRDDLDIDEVSPMNIHEEWKLFREKQLEKIDRRLWDRITEALIGFKLDGESFNSAKPIPSLNRILFDRLYQTDTQYGLGDTQVFTNKDLSRETILAVLADPNREFEYVNIEEFLTKHNFLTPEDIISAMNEIYMDFSVDAVNMIFFAVLHDAMSLKMEHSEILKTSWVALQISQNVEPSIDVPYDELRLVPGSECKPLPPTPSPNPTPSPTTTPSPR